MAENRPFALSDIDETRLPVLRAPFSALICAGAGGLSGAVSVLFSGAYRMGVFRFLCVLLNRRAVAGHVIKKPRKRPINKHGARRDELVWTA